MGIVVDMFTRQPIETLERRPNFDFSFSVPRQDRLIFDIDPMPNRMMRIAATVPSECMQLVADACRNALLDAGVLKVKPARRRASK